MAMAGSCLPRCSASSRSPRLSWRSAAGSRPGRVAGSACSRPLTIARTAAWMSSSKRRIESEALNIPPSLEKLAAQSAAYPADWLLRRLAQGIVARERALPTARVPRDAVRLAHRVDPVGLTATEQPLRAFVYDVKLNARSTGAVCDATPCTLPLTSGTHQTPPRKSHHDDRGSEARRLRISTPRCA